MPWLGAALGAGAGFLLWWFRTFLPEGTAAALALGLMTAATLARWERGLMPDRGVLGWSVLLAVLTARWLAFQDLPASPIAGAAAAGALARTVYVAAAWITRPAREGAEFARTVGSTGALAALAAGVSVTALLPVRQAWSSCAAAILLAFAARKFGESRGGLNDRQLGAAGLMTETALWMVASCRSCMW
jgi:cobalamin synthase